MKRMPIFRVRSAPRLLVTIQRFLQVRCSAPGLSVPVS